MSPILFLAGAVTLETGPEILVTAAREPLPASSAAASTTMLDAEMLDALFLPGLADLLRITPGASVAVSGPRGTQTQLRIRGNEASHVLLFVDGIRFNDPAAGNEPRFELLMADPLTRIEIVRGPQSALWGSEAIGGVVAVHGPDPSSGPGLAGAAEAGSLESTRLFARFASGGRTGVSATAAWQRSEGIDALGADGDRDGFETVAASLRAVHQAGALEIGAVGHWIEGLSEFDGFDPLTFRRADTGDETANRIGAARLWATGNWGSWKATAGASLLDSANRNRLGGSPLNRTSGDRLTLEGQVSRRLDRHLLTFAIDHRRERFRARDTAFGGATEQDRSRDGTAFVAEWRAEWSEAVTTDIAWRHDVFDGFRDASTWRASLLVRPVRAWSLHAAAGEGIAQPTFYDLHGFFPGSFVGNPALRPERSLGWEAGVRWTSGAVSASATFFASRLRDEIVDLFDPATFLSTTGNASGISRRRGIELEAGWRPSDRLGLTVSYTGLDSSEPRVEGTERLDEVRRPRHAATLAAFGRHGRFGWGTTLAWVGERRDTDFDVFPARDVRLDDYFLASLRVGWTVRPGVELLARVENALDAEYQDVVGYHSPGRTVHAGLRVDLGR